ncbi:hypothetical protein BKA82DRAFT_4016346 [Pisolithus tinctorius]|nr:hypothetical protein BKA82DRAFT_4016346 [Pisolithus tinctorius]
MMRSSLDGPLWGREATVGGGKQMFPASQDKSQERFGPSDFGVRLQLTQYSWTPLGPGPVTCVGFLWGWFGWVGLVPLSRLGKHTVESVRNNMDSGVRRFYEILRREFTFECVAVHYDLSVGSLYPTGSLLNSTLWFSVVSCGGRFKNGTAG